MADIETLTCPVDGCDRDDFESPHGLRVHLRRAHGWGSIAINEHLEATSDDDEPVAIRLTDDVDDELVEIDAGGLASDVDEVLAVLVFLDDIDPQEKINEVLGAWAAEQRDDPAVALALEAKAKRAVDA